MSLVLQGVAIHGTDFSGKTSLQSNLAAHFCQSNIAPVVNCGPLVKSGYLSRAKLLITQDWHKNKREINRLLIDAYLTDALEYKSEAIHVQDTYYQRTLAYCVAFGLKDLAEQLRDCTDRLLEFEYNIYLDASFDTRLARAKKRDFNSRLDLIMLKDRKLSNLLSELHKEAVQTSRNVINIDTDNLSEEEIFQHSVSALKGGVL